MICISECNDCIVDLSQGEESDVLLQGQGQEEGGGGDSTQIYAVTPVERKAIFPETVLKFGDNDEEIEAGLYKFLI
jgi:hypothetical protein